MSSSVRDDCLLSLGPLDDLPARLRDHRLAVVGGTGFVGSWLAESVAALNDQMGSQVRIDLLGRSAASWLERRPHLRRPDIEVRTVDVRSPFELAPDTTLVLFAAGVADPRVHASDAHRVFETHVNGIAHALTVASRLERLHRFVNLSSGLVLGGPASNRVLAETDIGALDFTRFHNVYAESRRAAESLATVYASQYRIPVSTVRAFTLIGPYQPFEAPFAINDFIRDALVGNDIRIHGDGTTRRSYLYGSDAAAWLLKTLLVGTDGGIYNLGGVEPASHAEIAQHVAAIARPTPGLVYKSQPATAGRSHDFLPDMRHTLKTLGVGQTLDTRRAIERTMQWHADQRGSARRVRLDKETE